MFYSSGSSSDVMQRKYLNCTICRKYTVHNLVKQHEVTGKQKEMSMICLWKIIFSTVLIPEVINKARAAKSWGLNRSIWHLMQQWWNSNSIISKICYKVLSTFPLRKQLGQPLLQDSISDFPICQGNMEIYPKKVKIFWISHDIQINSIYVLINKM